MSVNTYINGHLLRVGGFTQFQPSQSIQVSFMPEASATYEDKIFQYVGATTEDYINGLFYRCISDGEETPTYSWEAVNTEPMPTASTEEVAEMWSNPIIPPSSETKIIQRADWNLMTTEEKQAEGLIIIQDSDSGFERGVYVNGADYLPIGIYIPSSDANHVVCEAYYDNFDQASTTWGDGSIPAAYMDSTKRGVPVAAEHAVYVGAYETGCVPYVDMGTVGSYITAYAVMKTKWPNSQYERLLCYMGASRSTNGGILTNGDPVWISAWSNDTQTSVRSNDYVVVCIRYGGSANTAGFVYDATNSTVVKEAKPATTAGQAVTICRTDPYNNSESRPNDCWVRYFAVVDTDETDATIEANILALYNQFVNVT